MLTLEHGGLVEVSGSEPRVPRVPVEILVLEV